MTLSERQGTQVTLHAQLLFRQVNLSLGEAGTRENYMQGNYKTISAVLVK